MVNLAFYQTGGVGRNIHCFAFMRCSVLTFGGLNGIHHYLCRTTKL